MGCSRLRARRRLTLSWPTRSPPRGTSRASLRPATHVLEEWRGALLRVRLARMRLATPKPAAALVLSQRDGIAQPLAAFLLALGGALAFVAGATLGAWPLWGAGIVAVCGSVLAYRP